MASYCPRCLTCQDWNTFVNVGKVMTCRGCKRTVTMISSTELKSCPCCRRRYTGDECPRCQFGCDNCGQKKPYTEFPYVGGVGTLKRHGRGRVCRECHDENIQEPVNSPTEKSAAADF